MISNLRSPIYVQIEITSNCNNKCLHCYNFWRYDQTNERKELSISEWGEVAKILGENNIFYATITGGEPFVAKEKTYNLMNFLREQNIRIMINSNATLISQNEAEKLSTYPIEIFLVSLISSNPQQHNEIANSNLAFQKTVQGIKNLQKANINLAINMVASKINYQNVYTTGKWVYENLGIKNFSATPICPSVQEHQVLELNEKETMDTLGQLLQLKKKFGLNVDILEVFPTCLFENLEDEIVETFSKRMCTAGNTTITIGSEGNIRACSYDQKSYGNILNENFNNIWERMEIWRNNSLLPPECNECIIADSCGGGCRVNAKVKQDGYCELSNFYKGALKEKQEKFFKETSEIQLNKKLSLSKDILFREEKENKFVLVANSMHFVIINDKGLEVVKHLNTLSSFTPAETIGALNLDIKKDMKFFAELFQKGFLLESATKPKGGGKDG